MNNETRLFLNVKKQKKKQQYFGDLWFSPKDVWTTFGEIKSEAPS